MSRTYEVILTKGYRAIVDLADATSVVGYKWYALECTTAGRTIVYAVRDEGSRSISLHRQLLDAQPGEIVDHRDTDGLNNTRANLRKVTKSMNGLNRASPGGVHFAKQIKRWVAYATVNYKRKHLGCFKTEAEARACREEFNREIGL